MSFNGVWAEMIGNDSISHVEWMNQIDTAEGITNWVA